MSTFKIASKFKTEEEKKAEESALIDAAWKAVPPFEEFVAEQAKKNQELRLACKPKYSIIDDLLKRKHR